MERCYVVLKHVQNNDDARVEVETSIAGVTSQLQIAERLIATYYTSENGPLGGNLICSVSPCLNDERVYTMAKDYECIAATYFTVKETAIDDIDWV